MEPIGQGDENHDRAYAFSIIKLNIIWVIITYYTIIGEFGIVYKGYIIKKSKQGNVVTDTVAVKTLKGIIIIIHMHLWTLS